MLSFPPEPGQEVVILGAGFSKSLSDAMPLTDDLGNLVRTAVAAVSPVTLPGRFKRGQFEAWLSRIAEDQPDLTTPENLSNRTLFALCSQSLASAIDECVASAKETALSRPWLFDFIGTLHARQATVITFNQDTLIESAVEAAQLHSWDMKRWPATEPQPMISWWDCLDGQPAFPPTRYGFDVPKQTFRLLKLHGSTNWFWQSGDTTGTTTACWSLPGTLTSGQAVPDETAALRRELPGRVPLIVPPTAGKTTYYRTPMLTQLWQDARRALSRNNVHVSLLGYSIPPTDLVTSGMLRETLIDKTNTAPALIDVVDPNPGPVCANLRALGAWVSNHGLSVCRAGDGRGCWENCVHGIGDGPGAAVCD